MATPVVGATAAAMAVYMASRRTWCGAESARDPTEPIHFRGAHQAPNNWIEALYFFAEALRYMYGETLGRWRTADLLIGLAYLARREPQESPVADIAKAARPLGQGASVEQRQKLAEITCTRRRISSDNQSPGLPADACG